MESPSFESVWKTLQETAAIQRETARGLQELKESRKEADRQLQKYREEFDRAMRKSREEFDSEMRKSREEFDSRMRETDRQLRELKAEVSGVSANIGLGAEEYFQTALAKTLRFAGIQFDDMLPNLSRRRRGHSCEFDIVLVNHEAVAVIEAKHRVHQSLPEEMALKKAAEFRAFFPEYKDYKLYLGAAGFSLDKRAVDEARRFGVGLLKQDGDAVASVDIPLTAY